MSWSCLASFSFGKNDFINATSPRISLSVFVGFTFDKSFNIFVSEGHESFTCRIFGFFSGVVLEAIVTC